MIFLQPIRQVLATAMLLAFGVGCAAVAQAAGIVISPVVLEIGSPRKAIAVTINNDGDDSITFQTDALTWQQVDGLDQYEPTDELVVVPAIVVVPAHASQTIRVMLRSPALSPQERTYRLLIENITEELKPASAETSVTFKFGHNLPVMVAPAGKTVQAVQWKPCIPESAAKSNQTCVRLLNAGNRRIKIKSLTVTGDGWKQEFVLDVPQNVLTGAEREWRIPLATGPTGAVRVLQVDTAQGEILQATDGNF